MTVWLWRLLVMEQYRKGFYAVAEDLGQRSYGRRSALSNPFSRWLGTPFSLMKPDKKKRRKFNGNRAGLAAPCSFSPLG